MSERARIAHHPNVAQPEAANDAAARGPGQQEDADIVGRVLGGDVDAYRLLVEKYQRAIFACAWQYTGTRQDAEEAAQEAFVQGFEKLAKLREPRFFFPWMWRICAGVASKWRVRTRRMGLGTEGPEHASRETALPMELEERRAAVLDALAKLPDDQRQVLILRFWEGLDYATIAGLVGAGEDALYQRACRGLKKLRELLGGEFLSEFGETG